MENMAEKQVLLTGDRPTGKLHIGHYVGSLKNRVAMQNSGDYEPFIMIADKQAFTDNARNPEKIHNSLLEVALDYLAVGIDPSNPTVKTEIQQKGFGESIPAGFFIYPVSQAADIALFKGQVVPVGDDQEPMLEQTRELVRTFNNYYGEGILVEPQGVFPPKGQGRIPGLDGNAKMSKSLNNAIYLSDDEDTLWTKVKSMYTDPEHIRVEDPGHVEGNMVFTYLDIFDKDTEKVAELKAQYQAGGLGDMKIKKYLFEVLNAELAPMRERRAKYAEDKDAVLQMLRDGSDKARAKAQETMNEVRNAMGIQYWG